MNFLQAFLAIFFFFGIAILAMNIGYILKKREFRGSCSSNNPMIADKFGTCTVCGRKAGEACQDPESEKA